MSTPQPFVVGRSYRVKKTIEDSFSAVREGQVLRYLERGFAVYDERWCFNFLDDQGKRLYWCIHDSEPIEQWREVFEEEPNMIAPHEPPGPDSIPGAPVHRTLDQLISTAVAEKLSAIDTEKYLSERAERGSLAKFKKILGKVPSIKPEAGDELSNS